MVLLFITTCAVMIGVVTFFDKTMSRGAKNFVMGMVVLMITAACWLKIRDPIVVENHVVHDKTIVHEETIVHEIMKANTRELPPKTILDIDQCETYRARGEKRKDVASQYGQDAILYEIFKNEEPGHFMDLAAFAPKELSNTYFLETCMGWTGVCIEGDPRKVVDIARNRTCRLIPECVTENHQTVYFGSEATKGTNGIHNNENKAGVQILYCHPLKYLLDRYGSPKTFDYMSLDIEGSEDGALNSMGQYRIETMTIELFHLRPDATKMKAVRKFLDGGDYVPVIGFPSNIKDVCDKKNPGNNVFDLPLDELLGPEYLHGRNRYHTHDVLFVRRDSKYFEKVKKLYSCQP